jgi:hypothetical protein
VSERRGEEDRVSGEDVRSVMVKRGGKINLASFRHGIH